MDKLSVLATPCAQVLTPTAVMFPVKNADPILKVIVVVPWPDKIVVFAGAVHR